MPVNRIRPLDGNTKRAVFSRGKPMYPGGSPNPLGTNQHGNGVRPVAIKPPLPKRPLPVPVNTIAKAAQKAIKMHEKSEMPKPNKRPMPTNRMK